MSELTPALYLNILDADQLPNAADVDEFSRAFDHSGKTEKELKK